MAFVVIILLFAFFFDGTGTGAGGADRRARLRTGRADAMATSRLAGHRGVLLGLLRAHLVGDPARARTPPTTTSSPGRNLGWFVVGASIFASNIGSEHLVGLAGSGATSGVAMAHYELHAWCLLVLGWVLVPFYMRSRVYTMPEFLERRFSPTARWVLSIISLVAYVLTKIAVGIFAGGVVFGTLLPELQMNLGGMRARQLLDRLGGGRAPDRPLHGARRHARGGLHRGGADRHPRHRLGRWSPSSASRRSAAGASSAPRCGSGDVQPLEAAGARGHGGHLGAGEGSRAGSPGTSTATTPGSGMLFCAPIIGLWYWCTDQYIVQRALGAPERDARPAAAPSSRPS